MAEYKSLKFDRARYCLRYLVKKYEISRMYIPYYMCDVIRHTLFKEGCKPIFYHIDDNFMPATDFPKDSYILYPNYFGVFTKNVNNLVKIYPKIIIDNAHAYFNKPVGFAAFNSGIKFDLGENATLWILDDKTERTLYPNPDLPQKQKCRNSFFEFHKTYSGINQLKFSISEIICPFCYPLLAETEKIADSLVRDLTKKGLTVYRYWNPLPKSFNEYKFYSRLVPIPTTTPLMPNNIQQDN